MFLSKSTYSVFSPNFPCLIKKKKEEMIDFSLPLEFQCMSAEYVMPY